MDIVPTPTRVLNQTGHYAGFYGQPRGLFCFNPSAISTVVLTQYNYILYSTRLDVTYPANLKSSASPDKHSTWQKEIDQKSLLRGLWRLGPVLGNALHPLFVQIIVLENISAQGGH